MSRTPGNEPKPTQPRLEDYLAVMLGVRSREGFTFGKMVSKVPAGELKGDLEQIASYLDQDWLNSAQENFEVSPIPREQVSYETVRKLIVDFYTGLGLEYLEEVSSLDTIYFVVDKDTELHVTTSIYLYQGKDPDRKELLVTASKDPLWSHHRRVSKRFGKK